MTHDNVDWVAVLFHAAKQIGAENKRLQQENKELELSLSWCQDALEREAALTMSIHKAYESYHSYIKSQEQTAAVRSIESVVDEMVELWLSEMGLTV